MIRLLEYRDPTGRSPFADWFDELDAQAAARIVVSLTRLTQGNVANVKSVGSGVQECRMNFGPGYRVYFGRDGDEIILLLAGGTKRRQQHDIEAAHARWNDYKRRKKEAR